MKSSRVFIGYILVITYWQLSHVLELGRILRECINEVSELISTETERRAEIDRVLDAVADNERTIVHALVTGLMAANSVVMADPIYLHFPPTTVTAKELVQRAMWRAGNLNTVVFVPHTVVEWAGLAMFYTSILDNNNGFGPVLNANPGVQEGISGAIRTLKT